MWRLTNVNLLSNYKGTVSLAKVVSMAVPLWQNPVSHTDPPAVLTKPYMTHRGDLASPPIGHILALALSSFYYYYWCQQLSLLDALCCAAQPLCPQKTTFFFFFVCWNKINKLDLSYHKCTTVFVIDGIMLFAMLNNITVEYLFECRWNIGLGIEHTQIFWPLRCSEGTRTHNFDIL